MGNDERSYPYSQVGGVEETSLLLFPFLVVDPPSERPCTVFLNNCYIIYVGI
jgi:hypothetical protein